MKQAFAAPQSRQDVVNALPIKMELRDVPSDVFAMGIAEQVEFGLVRPQNGAVGADPMDSFRGMIERVLQRFLDRIGGWAARKRLARFWRDHL